MKDENKVLACVDQSGFADFVTDYAAWAARRMGAPLELLHILEHHPELSTSTDHSGAIGIDASDQLLAELAEEDGSRNRQAREAGRLFLNGLRERAITAGVDGPDVRQRHGSLVDTLAAQQAEVRLFVLGRRGEAAERTQRDLGRNVERVVRSLQKPILTVTEGFAEPRRVLIAFDGGAVTRKAVELVAASPLLAGLSIHLLMSGKRSRDSQKKLDWARERLQSAGFDATAALVPGDAETVIAGAVLAQGIDLLVMGAYSHSPLRNFFVGSKTSDLLRSARIPTLLVR